MIKVQHTVAPQPFYDYAIVGGGIVGTATALQLQKQRPTARILLLEKEPALAQHQTGHNSGVIHAGVYYKAGSLKADFCRRGAELTLAYCREHAIPFAQCGKLLVASNPVEQQRMQALADQCRQNGIAFEPLDAAQLTEMEPGIVGSGALHIPSSGITDYVAVTAHMARQFQQLGGQLRTGSELLAATEQTDHISLQTTDGLVQTRLLIACAGLMADRISRMLGIASDFAIIPFRGEYYRLREAVSHADRPLVKRLIYPIPDPQLPFLGVHLTPMINGGISVGPNALLGWKREGYGKVNISLRDSWDTLRFSGFWKLLAQHQSAGLQELKNSYLKHSYLQLVRKYCPQLSSADLLPYPAGVRAQAVNSSGQLIHDFMFAESPRSLHVCNAPSPAATSAIPIAEHVCATALTKDTQLNT